jgi:hypothetical protein
MDEVVETSAKHIAIGSNGKGQPDVLVCHIIVILNAEASAGLEKGLIAAEVS